MTKRQKSSRVRMQARRYRRGYQKQEPGIVCREVPGKLTGITQEHILPNRAKKRGDQSWNRGKTGRERRLAAKQARRHRLQKARQLIKSWRHELKKKLRQEFKKRMRSNLR